MNKYRIIAMIMVGVILAVISIMVLNTSLYLISIASSIANCIGVILPIIWAGFIWICVVPLFNKLFNN